eukprot:5841742-Alexandrium_andersonii.AAC.1
MERRIRDDPVLRTTQGEFPLIPFTHTREVSPPATRTSPMVLQLAEALDRAGVAAQPRSSNLFLLVERHAATATGQALPGQVRAHPVQRASEAIQSLAEGSR